MLSGVTSQGETCCKISTACDLTWLYTLRRWATETVAFALQSSSSVAINVAINSFLRCDLWSRSLLVTCYQLGENHRLEQCLLQGGHSQIFGVVFFLKIGEMSSNFSIGCQPSSRNDLFECGFLGSSVCVEFGFTVD